MSIRIKCALLLIAFEATLAGTILFTLFYTINSLKQASESFSVSRLKVEDIGRLRGAVANDRSNWFVSSVESTGTEAVTPEHSVDRLVDALNAQLKETDRQRLHALNERRHAAVSARTNPSADRDDLYRQFDQFLAELESKTWNDVRLAVNRTASAQWTTAIVLTLTMLVGALLGVIGIWLVRRWILLPVQDLKDAADELGRGRRDAPAVVRSGDELGQVATAFNRMAADLAIIEKRMVQRERLAAMGELVSYITHNIRNPLAGIQSSAEISCQHAEPDSPIVEQQRGIIQAIDRFLRWLREFEHACGGPLTIEPAPTDISALIDAVVAVFRPMADRDGVRIESKRNGAPASVEVDARQFEQALTAVVGNAIEAVDRDGVVEITVGAGKRADRWELAVADSGPGVPEEIRTQVFEPTFSTKRHGHGLGLALARKVTELHGGELECGPRPGGGAIFRFIMPIESE